MGGTIGSGLVTGIDCPGCKTPAACRALNPDQGVDGYCSDCDWSGTLDAIAMQIGELA